MLREPVTGVVFSASEKTSSGTKVSLCRLLKSSLSVFIKPLTLSCQNIEILVSRAARGLVENSDTVMHVLRAVGVQTMSVQKRRRRQAGSQAHEMTVDTPGI